MNLIVLGTSLVASLICVPLVRQIGLRLEFLARPRTDRWHKQPTPTLGGVGIFLSVLAGLLIGGFYSGDWGRIPWGMLVGAVFIFFLGFYDDLKSITPPAKFVGQIIAATIVVLFGYSTRFFTPRIANTFVAQVPNIMLTIFWLIGITNAINLLDNMDGLAGGISLITALILSYFFWRGGNLGLLGISLALAGSLTGFLVFNFPPAKIFMGDSGSLFLGFTLATLAIARQPQASNVFAIMGVPTLLFMLPILDTILVTITRMLRGQSPVQGGRDHTSHRLIAFGLSERQAVLTLYAVALLAGVAGVAVETIDYWLSLLLVPTLVLALAIFTAYLGRLKVVTPSNIANVRANAIARFMFELTYRRRLLEIIMDFALIGIAYYLAYFAHNGFAMNQTSLDVFLRTLPIAFGGTFLSFFIAGVYRGVWRYIGVGDFVAFAKATLASVVLVGGIAYATNLGDSSFLRLFLFYGVFLFLGLAATRSSFKILDQAYGHQAQEKSEKVVIYGAGDAGEMAARWILMNPQLGLQASGFVDENPYITGRQIHGVSVLGGIEKLKEMLEREEIDGVIIASDVLAEDEVVERVTALCRSHGRWVRVLRLEFELLD